MCGFSSSNFILQIHVIIEKNEQNANKKFFLHSSVLDFRAQFRSYTCGNNACMYVCVVITQVVNHLSFNIQGLMLPILAIILFIKHLLIIVSFRFERCRILCCSTEV